MNIVKRVMNHLRYSDVLVLDDIGAESITQWTRDEILLPILDERMNKGMKSLFYIELFHGRIRTTISSCE